MNITYKITETVYRNGCVWSEQQLFDDTSDFNQACEWHKESYGDYFDFSELPYASHNKYEVCYDLDVYIDGEYNHTAMCEIIKGY